MVSGSIHALLFRPEVAHFMRGLTEQQPPHCFLPSDITGGGCACMYGPVLLMNYFVLQVAFSTIFLVRCVKTILLGNIMEYLLVTGKFDKFISFQVNY